MDNVIFQASDLAKDRVRVLDAARSGRARVRDKDGTGLVMLPEAELEVLEGYARWSQAHNRLSALITSGRLLNVDELGEFAWLRVFDREDLDEFLSDLHSALVAGLADRNMDDLATLEREWRITARQLEDPLRRSVLLARDAEEELVEVEAPFGEQ